MQLLAVEEVEAANTPEASVTPTASPISAGPSASSDPLLCHCCQQLLSRAYFSRTQLKKRAGAAGCIRCIELYASTSPAPQSIPEVQPLQEWPCAACTLLNSAKRKS